MRLSGILVLLITTWLCLAQESSQQPPPATPDASAFADQDANPALNLIRDGLEGHSARRMLSAFDREKMDGYASFADQIQAFFDKYDAFRVHYRIAQSTVEGVRGVVLVDFEIEESPRGEGTAPQRKDSQLRFELERSGKAWKIVELRPRDFFS